MANVLPASGIKFQDRDIELLKGLFESRVMTSKHATAIYFDGRAPAATKRLQKLKSAGLLGERPRRAYDPAVLFLTLKAFRLLSERGILAEYPRFSIDALAKRSQVSPITLRHELEVMDVKTAFTLAIRATTAFSLSGFSTWPLLSEFKSRRPTTRAETVVKPDGFISIHEPDPNDPNGSAFEHSYFLELDRSTESQGALADKAACYLHFYQSGGFAERNGAPRTDFKEFPFRVLMVFKNAERRNNAAERLLQNNPPILKQAWLTTFQEVLADPLGMIWMRPVDYRSVISGTGFDFQRRQSNSSYRRSSEREAFVESRLTRLRLMNDPPETLDRSDSPQS